MPQKVTDQEVIDLLVKLPPSYLPFFDAAVAMERPFDLEMADAIDLMDAVYRRGAVAYVQRYIGKREMAQWVRVGDLPCPNG